MLGFIYGTPCIIVSFDNLLLSYEGVWLPTQQGLSKGSAGHHWILNRDLFLGMPHIESIRIAPLFQSHWQISKGGTLNAIFI